MRVSRSLVPSSDGAAIIRSSGRRVSVACPCHQYQNSSRSRPPVGIPVLSSQHLAELLTAATWVIPSAQSTLPDTVGSFSGRTDLTRINSNFSLFLCDFAPVHCERRAFRVVPGGLPGLPASLFAHINNPSMRPLEPCRGVLFVFCSLFRSNLRVQVNSGTWSHPGTFLTFAV